MTARLIHLKVKIKSLAAEAQIIRKEAAKTSGLTKQGLNEHRTTVVREWARYNLLAYGFLRGREYKQMEAKCYIEPNWKKVKEIAVRFGATDEILLDTWINDAKVYIKSMHS